MANNASNHLTWSLKKKLSHRSPYVGKHSHASLNVTQTANNHYHHLLCLTSWGDRNFDNAVIALSHVKCLYARVHQFRGDKNVIFRRVSACSIQRLLQTTTNVIFTSVGSSNDFSRPKPRGGVLRNFLRSTRSLYVYLRSDGSEF